MTRLGAKKIKQNCSQAANQSRHVIVMDADEAKTRLVYRWLNHTGLAKLTYMSNNDDHTLVMPNAELSNAASLRIARKSDEDEWRVDSVTYPVRAQDKEGPKKPSSIFHAIKYPAKTSPSTKLQGPPARSASLPTLPKKTGDHRPTMPYAKAVEQPKQQAKHPAKTQDSAKLTASEKRPEPFVLPTKTSVASSEQELAILHGLAELNASNARYGGREKETEPENGLPGWIEEVKAHQLKSDSPAGNSETEELGDLISFEEPIPAIQSGTTDHVDQASEHDHSDDLIDLTSNHSDCSQPTRPVATANGSSAGSGNIPEGEDVALFGLLDDPLKELHKTMRQQAGRKTRNRASNSPAQQPRRNVPGLSSAPNNANDNAATPSSLMKNRLLKEMKSTVRDMTENLRMMSGEIGMELKFGRLYLKNTIPAAVATEKTVPESLIWTVESATGTLKQERPADMRFQTILSGRSADADLLTQIHEPGEPRWNSPVMSVVYRFICLLNDIPFKVDVDSQSFTPICQGLEEEIDSVFVHCPEHAWDMKVCATRARINLPAHCMDFAHTLATSLSVL